MKLKRVHKRDAGGELVQPLTVDRIEVLHTGASPEQNFSDTLIAEGLSTGLVTIKGNMLVLQTHPEPLVYTIRRRPGRYALPGGKRQEVIHAFECVLNQEQHEKFRHQPMGGG